MKEELHKLLDKMLDKDNVLGSVEDGCYLGSLDEMEYEDGCYEITHYRLILRKNIEKVI